MFFTVIPYEIISLVLIARLPFKSSGQRVLIRLTAIIEKCLFYLLKGGFFCQSIVR